MSAIATFLMMVSPAFAGATVPDVGSSKDVEMSVEALSQFRAAAQKDPAAAIGPATTVCRLLLGESLRGLNFTKNGLDEYDGPERPMLTLFCQAYLQGAYDTLAHTQALKQP